jgi:molybdenum cofactor biosynthesis protein MoaC/molybdopterin converting factor subunit 1
MRVRVLLFAMLRQRAGTESLELDLPDGATAADALVALGHRDGLADLIGRLPLRVAVNREYVPESTALAAGDELAVIPPVSGGAPLGRVTSDALSAERLLASVASPAAGATVLFMGTTRDVTSLDYEAYSEMAEERIAGILAGCIERHGLQAAAAEHRIGAVPLGEPSVLVAVSAPHRAEAFAGAREAIDRIKEEAPIWKTEAGEPASVGELPHLDADPGASSSDGRSLTHLGAAGEARMVDVSDKQVSERHARAEATVLMAPETARAVARGDSKKGDVLGTARIAAIQAAKRTADLIPLAHQLPLTHVEVDFGIDQDSGRIEIVAAARTADRTGVEMEAMTAAAVAALTIYDMTKGLERGIEIDGLRLLEKSGGKADWRRADPGSGPGSAMPAETETR